MAGRSQDKLKSQETVEQELTKAVLDKGRFVMHTSLAAEGLSGWSTVPEHSPDKDVFRGGRVFTFHFSELRDPRAPVNLTEAGKRFVQQEHLGDALSIRPLYVPDYRISTQREQVTRYHTNLFGKSIPKQVEEDVTTRTFIGNRAVTMGEINKTGNDPEEAVEILYETFPGADYHDGYGRGNALYFRLVVPRSLGEKIAETVEQRPSLIRNLVTQLILNEEKGIQAKFREENPGRHVSIPAENLPHYDNAPWRSSNILIEADFTVPQAEYPTLGQLSETKIQELKKSVRSVEK